MTAVLAVRLQTNAKTAQHGVLAREELRHPNLLQKKPKKPKAPGGYDTVHEAAECMPREHPPCSM